MSDFLKKWIIGIVSGWSICGLAIAYVKLGGYIPNADKYLQKNMKDTSKTARTYNTVSTVVQKADRYNGPLLQTPERGHYHRIDILNIDAVIQLVCY